MQARCRLWQSNGADYRQEPITTDYAFYSVIGQGWLPEMSKFGTHHLRIQAHDTPLGKEPDVADHAEAIRSWFTALVGAEHLSLLV
jgi:hypothetical protein